MLSPASGKKVGLAVIQARNRLAVENLCREGLEVFVDNELSISQQCTLAATRFPSIPWLYEWKQRQEKSDFSSLFSTAPSFAPCPQQTGRNLESNQDGHGLQHMPCKDRMRVLSLFTLDKGQLRGT